MQGQSKQIFNSLCEVMQDIDFSYDKKEDELVILSGAQGKDLPMSFMLRVSDERQIVSFVSVIPVSLLFKIERIFAYQKPLLGRGFCVFKCGFCRK